MHAPDRVNIRVDRVLDITRDRCPMTYVRVRLALDQIEAGQVLQVTLQGDEPARNIPKTATEQGHEILDVQVEANDVNLLWIRKR